jgi:hypothetical protein
MMNLQPPFPKVHSEDEEENCWPQTSPQSAMFATRTVSWPIGHGGIIE